MRTSIFRRFYFDRRCAADIDPSLPACVLCAASDDLLFDQIRLKREDAFEHFMKRYYRHTFRIARRILRDEGEAEDTTQETFVRFFRTTELYDKDKGSPPAFLLNIAYRASMDRRRHLTRRGFYDQESTDTIENQVGVSKDWAYDPLRVLFRNGLDIAYASLDPWQQEAIELRCFDGLTFKEIASRLGETVSNACHYYYRGLESIQAYLQPEGDKQLKAFQANRRKRTKMVSRENCPCHSSLKADV